MTTLKRLRHRRTVRRFFGELVGSGSLVFDVGANDGRYTRVFLAPGANVVAIEPNPKLATHLAGRWPAATTERCAAGAEPGDAILYLSDIPIFWTLSSEWMALAKDRGLHNTWNGTAVTVAVTTLDRLGKHGNPTTSRSTSKATNVSAHGTHDSRRLPLS